MKQGFKRQSGMTQIAWILAIVFLMTSLVLFIRMVPPYMESLSVKKSLQSIAEDPSIKQMSAHKVREMLNRKLYVNSVKNVNAKALEIERDNHGMSFRMNYEVRIHAVGNVDVVLRFDQKVQVE